MTSLALVCAALFFLAAPLRKIVDQTMLERRIDRVRLEERFDLRFQTVYTFSLSISMATVAGLLALLYRGSRRPFPAHGVFALHYVGFLYLLAIPVWYHHLPRR